MSTTFLGGLTFILVLAGIIILHEIGHFVVARLLGIEIEEFGVGIPPRLLRLWRAKGWMVVGRWRLKIPANTTLPFHPVEAEGRVVEVTAIRRGEEFILRAIALAASEDGQVDSTPTLHEASDGTVQMHGTLKEIHPGTLFTLNWIPLGGFVRPKGEDDPTIPGGLAAAKPWRRILVLLAGATMNLLTAVAVYAVLFSQTGIPDGVRIDEVAPASPAEAAGMLPGDLILSVDGQEIHRIDELQNYTTQHAGEEVQVTLLRGEERLRVPIVPRQNPPEGQGRMGVLTFQQMRPPHSIFETIGYSFQATYQGVRQILALPGRLIAGAITPDQAQVAGPRSIWNLFQQSVARDVESRQEETAAAAAPTHYTLAIIISLTITVGVVNLLPFPALDGGRIFFSLIELVFRRRVPPRLETAVHTIGFFLALSLMGYFYIADIINPIAIKLP